MDSVESFDDDFNEWYQALGGRNAEEKGKENENDGEGCGRQSNEASDFGGFE